MAIMRSQIGSANRATLVPQVWGLPKADVLTVQCGAER